MSELAREVFSGLAEEQPSNASPWLQLVSPQSIAPEYERVPKVISIHRMVNTLWDIKLPPEMPKPNFQGFGTAYRALHCGDGEERGIRTHSFLLEAKVAAEATGLEMTKSEEQELFLSSDTFTNAIRTGTISHLRSLNESGYLLLASYANVFLGLGIEEIPSWDDIKDRPLPEVPNAAIGRTPSGMRYEDFLKQCFTETKRKPYTGKRWRGPRYPDFEERLGHLHEELKRISPELSEDTLHASSYRSKAAKAQIELLRGEKRFDFDSLYSRKWRFLAEVAGKYRVEDADTTLELGILEAPGYVKQIDPTACVNACFNMVLGDITGAFVSESEIFNTVGRVHKDSRVHDEEYLKVFTSELLIKEYGSKVETIEFTGMDIGTIGEIASRLKNKGYRVYCVTTLGTETSSDKNVWHSVVLVGADEKNVICHDPVSHGKAFRAIAKEDFMSRWAVAYNRGYLVIAC